MCVNSMEVCRALFNTIGFNRILFEISSFLVVTLAFCNQSAHLILNQSKHLMQVIALN